MILNLRIFSHIMQAILVIEFQEKTMEMMFSKILNFRGDFRVTGE